MYHCHVRFYLVGCRREPLEAVKGMPPLESFTHEFADSESPRRALTEQADVILVNLQEMEPEKTVRTLAAEKRETAQLIVMAGPEQIPELGDSLSCLQDLWILPMGEEELRFRFLRWQQTYKMSKDFWQTSHYLDAALNSTPNLIWYKTKDGIHEKVNDSFCRTVNKTRKQVEGQGHAYIWDVEEDDPACIESEREVMERRETCVSEEMIQTGGGARLLTTYKSPLYDLDGSVMGTVGVAIDVTRERAYAKELKRKNQSLELLFTTMDCGIICQSMGSFRLISINQAALNILGYKTQEDLERDGFCMIAASVVDEDKALIENRIRGLQKAGDSASVEYRVRHDNGEIIHVLGNFKLVEEDGELICQRFLLDCTAQKLQEKREKLEAEQRQMKLIQALSIDYNLVCSMELDTGAGSVLRIHKCKYHILENLFQNERSLRESLEQYIQTCVYADDRDMMVQMLCRDGLRSELAEKEVFYISYRTMCGGDIRYFQMKAVRIGAEGESTSVALGFRCVDEEVRSEMEKKALLEDALLQANRASKAKSVFLSNMSHDIRTPMNAIVGFTALALTHLNRKEQVEEYLKKIMTSGNHLLSLINDILDMSRIESGKMHLEEKPCSLPEVFHSLRSIVQAEIHAKQLELYIDAVDVVHEEIYCDKLRLNQVLLNLLSNSIKYTGAGGIVSMKITEKPGAPEDFANYEFDIRDTGIGMSQEFVEHIFEPFERERNSTISGIQGTGLGMAITKNIVDMMNGSIEVKSEQGVGTQFKVCIAFRLSEQEREPQVIPQLKDCRALVVDDDFNTCDSVSYMLQQIGMRSEWTLSGKEAVLRTRQAVMRGDTYGVYIIDWLLPDMNGVELTRRLRKEAGDEIPVIVITAYDWSDIEEEAREAGVTAFCSKPLFMSELRSCLYSVVNAAEQEKMPEAVELPHTGRILLAEDNELNQEIAVAVLEEAGFTVEVAGNGRIAVEMLKSSQPGYYRLILMDVQMPVMNGYEATEQIRQMEDQELASIPILAMTANAFEEDKREALRCGMNGHIAKPIDIDRLIATLGRMMT